MVVNKPTGNFVKYAAGWLIVIAEKKIKDNMVVEESYYSCGGKIPAVIKEYDSNSNTTQVKRFYKDGTLREQMTDKFYITYYTDGNIETVSTVGDKPIVTHYRPDGTVSSVFQI